MLEGCLLGGLLLGIPILIVLVWLGKVQTWLEIDSQQYKTVATFAYSWLAGALGGAAFSAKWLIHTVAKNTWHLDQ